MLGVIDDVMDQLCHRWRHWHDDITTLYFFMLLLWKETMGRKGWELSLDITKLFVVLYENGHKLSETSKLLSVSYMTISNIVKKYRNTGSAENMKRSGRPKLVSDRDYRKLERLLKANRRDFLSNITSKFNENREIQVSRKIVQSHLSQQWFQKGVLKKKVVVKAENRRKRLPWYLEKRRWVVDGNWNSDIFGWKSNCYRYQQQDIFAVTAVKDIDMTWFHQHKTENIK